MIYNYLFFYWRNGSPNFTSIKFRQEWYDWASTTFMESIFKENPASKQVPVYIASK